MECCSKERKSGPARLALDLGAGTNYGATSEARQEKEKLSGSDSSKSKLGTAPHSTAGANGPYGLTITAQASPAQSLGCERHDRSHRRMCVVVLM